MEFQCILFNYFPVSQHQSTAVNQLKRKVGYYTPNPYYLLYPIPQITNAFIREAHHRTRVVGILPNEAACVRLVSTILMGIDDVWQTGRVYITFEKEELFLSICIIENFIKVLWFPPLLIRQ